MEVKNPFSLYDFLGYLFPGALAVFIIYTICKVNMSSGAILPFDYVDKFVDFLRDENKKIDLTKVLIPFLIISYMFVHLFSYLSSLTIEYFTNRIFDYPSEYLLGNSRVKKPFKQYWGKFTLQAIIRYPLLLILLLILAPFAIIVFPLKFVRDFVTRKLETFYTENIQQKIKALNTELKLEHVDNKDKDFHRLVMHYVYLNIPKSQNKTNNYIALYGYLRATTLIMVLFTDWILYVGIKSICINEDKCVDWASVIFVLSCWMVSFISYMGFVKFYRRFTLENFMTLLTGKWH